MQVRVLRSIKGIERRVWDALCTQVVFSYGWCAAIEEGLAAIVEPRHLLLEDGSRLLGILPCWIQRDDPYYHLGERLAGRFSDALPRVGLAVLPALLAYSPLAHRSECFLGAGVDRGAAIREFVAAMRRVCRDEHLRAYGWPFVEGLDSERDAALRAAGLRGAYLAPTAVWENHFEDFEAYQRNLRPSRRRVVSNEINRWKRSNVQIVQEPCAGVESGTLAALYANHYARYQRSVPHAFSARFFDALKREFGDRVILHTAREAGDLISYSLVLGDDERWHMFLSGHVADERSHADTLYFNLNYYFPIRRAIETGVRRLDFGMSSYDAKVPRGCRLEPVTLWLGGRPLALRLAFPPWLRFIDWWYRRKHRKFEQSARTP